MQPVAGDCFAPWGGLAMTLLEGEGAESLK